jgi:hypothetical protein
MAALYKRMPPDANVLLHRRLIDDILVVYRGPRHALDRYLARYGSLHPDIRITWTVSDRNFEFLDIAGCKGERFSSPDERGLVRIDFSTHQKRLNKYLYLPSFSHHSDASLRGFIHGELLRYLRNSSNLLAFHTTRSLFYHRLRARGHPHKFLLQIFAKVQYQRRERVLEIFKAGLEKRHHQAQLTLRSIRGASSLQAFSSFSLPSPPPALFIPSARSTESAAGRACLTLTQRSQSLRQAHSTDRQKFPYPLLVVHLHPRSLGSLLRHQHPLQRQRYPAPAPPAAPGAPATPTTAGALVPRPSIPKARQSPRRNSAAPISPGI